MLNLRNPLDGKTRIRITELTSQFSFGWGWTGDGCSIDKIEAIVRETATKETEAMSSEGRTAGESLGST
jgi:hypothetical protein